MGCVYLDLEMRFKSIVPVCNGILAIPICKVSAVDVAGLVNKPIALNLWRLTSSLGSLAIASRARLPAGGSAETAKPLRKTDWIILVAHGALEVRH